MCVAIVCQPGKKVPNKSLFQGWSRNRDGGGFAYVKDGSVVIKKGFDKYNEFQKAYDKATEENPDSVFLVHMRIRTSGEIDEANTHPFKIKGGAMIHNGILFTPDRKQEGPAGKRKSDTQIFVDYHYNNLQKEVLEIAEKDIVEAIGLNNKLCFLYDDGSYFILNEDAGYWEDGVWYSNTSCKVYDYSKNSSTSSVTPSSK